MEDSPKEVKIKEIETKCIKTLTSLRYKYLASMDTNKS